MDTTSTFGSGTVETVRAGAGAQIDLILSAGATNRWRVGYSSRSDAGTRIPVDLTGWTARAQIRRSTSSDTAWITLSTGGHGIIVDTDGWVTCTIAATVTDLPEWGNRTGVWDLELTDPVGEITRLAYGRVEITAQVTR